jgi:hypothetical protein
MSQQKDSALVLYGYLFAFLLLALSLVAPSCTEDELNQGRLAEAHYVDLLHALTFEDAAAARKASSKLSRTISTLPVRWYRPMEDEESENMYYHLAKAERAYTECRLSIAEANTELAGVQLDRAVYELSAADPVAFNELYVGSIYDFVATWLEVSRAVHDQELCSMVWVEFSRYGKDARHAWQLVKWRKPSAQLYAFTDDQLIDFRLAHGEVDDAIDHFITVIKSGDQCSSQVAAKEVDLALWGLLSQFRSVYRTDL